MDIIKGLEDLGLSSNEAKAYLAILKLQQANPHQIAIEAGLERTTIYKLLESLTEKTLISKVPGAKKAEYVAEPSLMLKQMLSKKESILQDMLPLLAAIQGSSSSRPIVKFYDQSDGIKKVVQDSVNCQEKIRRDFAFVENIVDLLGIKFVHKNIEERIKNKVLLKSLRRQPDKEMIAEKDWYLKKENEAILREVRYLPKDVKFDPLIVIYDHVVAIISSKKESFAVVIESREFSEAMKTLFDLVWTMAKK